MFNEWNKFRGWVVLEFFLKHPNKKTYIKELSRTLKIGPRTAETYLKLYKNNGLLSKEIAGNTHLYRLNNEDYMVKELKKIFVLSAVKDTELVEKTKKETNPISIALYGSAASGTYSAKSDIDILIVTQDKVSIKETKISQISRKLEQKLNMEVQITLMDFREWRKSKSQQFGRDVLGKHILLYGVKL